MQTSLSFSGEAQYKRSIDDFSPGILLKYMRKKVKSKDEKFHKKRDFRLSGSWKCSNDEIWKISHLLQKGFFLLNFSSDNKL